MKNKRRKEIRLLQRQYHRNHAWLSHSRGLYIPHSYEGLTPNTLSLWDDVGFVLNRRQVMVWWRHPRFVYANHIKELASQEAGAHPDDDWLIEGATANYGKRGRSRKKIDSYTSRSPSQATRDHYDRLFANVNRLRRDGIEFSVTCTWKVEELTWATGIDLVAPLEVRDENELADLAQLARQLLLRRITLDQAFPQYRYTREDWLREEPLRSENSSDSHAVP